MKKDEKAFIAAMAAGATFIFTYMALTDPKTMRLIINKCMEKKEKG